MIVSPVITPFRWYDKFYEQNRYDVDCGDHCDFNLITDRGALLPFQIKRTASLYKVIKWVLRKSCNEAEPKLLTDAESKFYGNYQDSWEFIDCNVRTIDTSEVRTLSDGSVRTLSVVSTCVGSDKMCNILRSGSSSGVVGTIPDKLTIGKKYRITVVISEVKLSFDSTLYLKFNNGSSVLINNINATGLYEYEFTATSTEIHFEVGSSGYVGVSDYIGIKEMQIVALFVANSNDITLNPQLLTIVNVDAVDYIVYFGDKLGVSIPAGNYYSVIKTLDNKLYYSEVISVKDFVPGLCEYVSIEWSNNCDVQDVVYQSIAGKLFKNKVYMENSVISKPEYPYVQEGEEDGNKEFIPTFQKWNKELNLLVGKTPEFIADSLSAMSLCDTINITYTKRNNQLQASQPVSIKSVEASIEYILNDCFQNVTLKVRLDEKYTRENCCGNNTLGAIIVNNRDIEITETDFVYGIDESESSSVAVDDASQETFIKI
jgi:hypothetical protein